MELRHLRYFVTVAEERNVSRAAARLFITQPAISRQLKDLEYELGVTLFERTTQGIKLTPAGETFLVHARDLLRSAQTASDAMVPFRKPARERLAIGYIPSVLAPLLAPRLRRFTERHPGAVIELRELPPAEQVEKLRAGDIDIALIGNPCDELRPEFDVLPLARVPLAAVLRDDHALAAAPALDLAALARETFLGLDEARFPGRNDLICDACRQAGFTPDLRIRADSLTSLLGLVAGGQGVTLMPDEAAALPHPQTVFVPLSRPAVYVESAAIWKPDSRSRTLRRFIDSLRELQP